MVRRAVVQARNPEWSEMLEQTYGPRLDEDVVRTCLGTSYARNMGSASPGLMQFVIGVKCAVHSGIAVMWGRFPASRRTHERALVYHNPPFESVALQMASGYIAGERNRCSVLVAPPWYDAPVETGLTEIRAVRLRIYTNCPALLLRSVALSQ